MGRFDEMELNLGGNELETPAAEPVESGTRPPRLRRFLALALDLSIFLALALALGTMIDSGPGMLDRVSDHAGEWLALSGYLIVLSYFYFVGCWLLWARTVGSAIFDVAVTGERGPLDLGHASRRWAATILCIATGGLGYVPGLWGSRKTLADRLSDTRAMSL